MRAVPLALLVLLPLAAPSTLAGEPAFEATGTYVAANGLSFFTDACSLYGETNGIFSNCLAVPDGLDGKVVRARDEGTLAPATQRLRVCFYAQLNWQIRCPDPIACPEGWTFCGIVPPGSRLAGVSSATGVNVQWRMVVE